MNQLDQLLRQTEEARRRERTERQALQTELADLGAKIAHAGDQAAISITIELDAPDMPRARRPEDEPFRRWCLRLAYQSGEGADRTQARLMIVLLDQRDPRHVIRHHYLDVDPADNDPIPRKLLVAAADALPSLVTELHDRVEGLARSTHQALVTTRGLRSKVEALS